MRSVVMVHLRTDVDDAESGDPLALTECSSGARRCTAGSPMSGVPPREMLRTIQRRLLQGFVTGGTIVRANPC